MRPELIYDPLFGGLRYDASAEWYEGDFEFSGELVRIGILLGSDPPEDTVEAARERFPLIWQQEPRLRQEVASALVGDYNRAWRAGNEITVEEFSKRICHERFVFHSDGSFDLWYEDDDLFAGHSLFGSFSSDGLLRDAGIEG